MDEIKVYFSAASQVLSIFKQAKDLLPESKEKDEASKALVKAESSFKAAEAQFAQSMGFELCQCAWPPNIMILKHEHDEYQCKECGNAITRIRLRRERKHR